MVNLGHQVLRLRPRPGQNALESRDHGLETTTLVLIMVDVVTSYKTLHSICVCISVVMLTVAMLLFCIWCSVLSICVLVPQFSCCRVVM